MGKSHTSQDLGRVIQNIRGDVANWSMVSLIEELKEDYWGLRREAARTLGQMGSDAEVAVTPLIEALRDRDNYTRRIISHALYGIGKPAICSLVDSLKDDDIWVRRRAVEALGNIGPVIAEVTAWEDPISVRHPEFR